MRTFSPYSCSRRYSALEQYDLVLAGGRIIEPETGIGCDTQRGREWRENRPNLALSLFPARRSDSMHTSRATKVRLSTKESAMTSWLSLQLLSIVTA
jgi:hypothetical protein